MVGEGGKEQNDRMQQLHKVPLLLPVSKGFILLFSSFKCPWSKSIYAQGKVRGKNKMKKLSV